MNTKYTIGIIGFGIVGKALQHGFAQTTDFRIYDINPVISENTIEEVCNDSDFIFICVPTPMDGETGISDYSIVEDTIKKCRPHVKDSRKILIIKSTVVPGTTELLQEKYPDVRIVFNPEFLTARSFRLDFINTSRIILGGYSDDVRTVYKLYRQRFPNTPILCTDPTSAEAAKCFANCFFATKVALCNEFYDICEGLEIDYNNVMGLVMRDGRIGNSHIDVPGHDGDRGFGGLCFPKDINATIKKAEDVGVDPIIMKAAWNTNLRVRKNKDWLYIDGAVSNNNAEKKAKK